MSLSLSIAKITPRRDSRAILLGATGCGKTTLAKRLLQQFKYVVAIDPKCTLGGREGLDEYELIRDPRALSRSRSSRLQYRPAPEFQSIDWFDAVYQWVYDRGNTMVYTDDLVLILEGRQPPDGFRACVTCGRERGVGMIHATQRPAGVPLIALTESEYIYAFVLRNDNDRKACIAAGLDERIRTDPILENYWFYLSTPDGVYPRKLKLKGV